MSRYRCAKGRQEFTLPLMLGYCHGAPCCQIPASVNPLLHEIKITISQRRGLNILLYNLRTKPPKIWLFLLLKVRLLVLYDQKGTIQTVII